MFLDSSAVVTSLDNQQQTATATTTLSPFLLPQNVLFVLFCFVLFCRFKKKQLSKSSKTQTTRPQNCDHNTPKSITDQTIALFSFL